MNSVAQMKRSGRDVLLVLALGSIVTCLIYRFLFVNIFAAGAITYLALGALVLVHAPDDAPGGPDNIDGSASHPAFLALACAVAVVTFGGCGLVYG